MQVPFFYIAHIADAGLPVQLDEDTSKHVVQVLRMQNGELLNLTDGKGNIYSCVITDNHRKKCMLQVKEKTTVEPSAKKISIAISPVKNNTRFEWFLEKATEIGVSSIVPLICERTEKQQVKPERMQQIIISAMLQSRQCWMPQLKEPVKFSAFVKENIEGSKLIAHCDDQHKNPLSAYQPHKQSTILIGPEGDFSPKEIEEALANGFAGVSLGNTRLRTETAGMVAAVLLCIS
ncbi:MAG: 16S rRNA (uracil(1498)-N(3))-methyltransferase [Ferruginibacter sp.]